MLTLTELRKWDGGRWSNAADNIQHVGGLLESTGQNLKQGSTKLLAHWPDDDGVKAWGETVDKANWLKDQYDPHRGVGEDVFQAVGKISETRRQVEHLREQVFKYTVGGKLNPFRIDDSGHVTLTPQAQALPPPINLDLLNLAQKIQHVFVTQLYAATVADWEAATSIAGKAGIDPGWQNPLQDAGLVDLSPDAIRRQAANGSQGQLKDCYFLSSLMAIGTADPQFIRENMKWDPQALEYEVTLHGLGGIQKVRVSPAELVEAGVRDGQHAPTYLAIYEKAYTKTFGGAIKSHTGFIEADAMHTITGRFTAPSFPGPHSPEELRTTLEAHPPGAVTASTSHWVNNDVPDDKRLVPQHAYRVVKVDSQGNVTLANPWGPSQTRGADGHTYPGMVTLTREEFRRRVQSTTQLNGPFR